VSNILSKKILTEEMNIHLHGLDIESDGRGHVIVRDAVRGHLITDSHYTNVEEVEGVIDNIITVKWGR